MIKQPHEVELMAQAGALLAQVFDRLDRTPLDGGSTLEINDLVERMIVDEHHRPCDRPLRARTRLQRGQGVLRARYRSSDA